MVNAVCYLQCILFADDTTLYGHGKNVKFLRTKVIHNLQKLQNWFDSNKLTLNVDKTQFMVIKKGNEKIYIKLELYGIEICEVQKMKFLGIWIDNKLNWEYHIKHVLSKMATGIYSLKCVKHILYEQHKR